MADTMMPSDIRDRFLDRGWQSRSGGELYFNGFRTTTHPHLHLQIASLRSGTRPRIGGDLRMAVTMLAYSDGRHGKTFIRDNGNTVVNNWAALGQTCPMNNETREEFAWIMDYFAFG